MDIATLIALLLGLLAGAGLGWWLTRNRQGAEVARAEAAVATARGEAERARGETERIRAELAGVRVRDAEAESRVAESHTQVAQARAEASEVRAAMAGVSAQLAAMEAQRDAAREQVAALTADAERMVKEFRLVSSDALATQAKGFDVVAAERLRATEQAMAPVTTLLKEFQQRLTEVEKERASLAAELKEQVSTVTATGEQLRRETNALATALRKPQVRGAWGELQLKRAVELAGMVDHCDFIEQATTTSATDATIRPDLKVLFGGDKFVYVDSKVPLGAFLDAQATEDEAERGRHLQTFGRNVRTHIDQLSAKEYWRADAGSPEFVILFVPSEALYAEALALMPDLHEHATRRNIVLANPSSLIALLRAVAYSWKQAALAENAKQVLELGRELHSRLSVMGSNFDKLGRAITSSVKAYNDTVGSLEGRVLVQARRFQDLQVTDHELSAPKGVQDLPRALVAPELVESAQQAEVWSELRRTEPSTQELVESTQPRPQDPPSLEQRRRLTAT